MRYLRKAKPDANHVDICDKLRKNRVHVTDLSGAGNGVLDIHTWYEMITAFIEIKAGNKAKDELKKSQIKFLAEYPGHCGIAKTFEEAFRIATQPWRYALDKEQKRLLGIYHRQMKGEKVHLATIEKIIYGDIT